MNSSDTGFTLELRQYPMGWRVNVRRAGVDAIVGSGWDALPWRSMQQAAWAALRRDAAPSPGRHGGRGIVAEPFAHLIDAQTLDHGD